MNMNRITQLAFLIGAVGTANLAHADASDAHKASETAKERRLNGLAVGGFGAATIVGALVFFGAGTDLLSDADGICPGGTCTSATDLTKATKYHNVGERYQAIGVGMGIGGVALVAVGAYLLATAPKESSVAVQVNANGGGVAYTFGF